MTTTLEPEPPENERGPAFPIREASPFTKNPTSKTTVNPFGLFLENKQLVRVVDGRTTTEFKWEKKKNGPVADAIVATAYDEPEALAREMTADEVRGIAIDRDVLAWFLSGGEGSLREIARRHVVSHEAVDRRARLLLANTGTARLFDRVARRVAARARVAKRQAKKGKVTK
ncbi:MAG: hypothetical protein Q8N18_06050 [Opitutaceae bacterium]|nr:hypothetical protein [Opitutaceae bacterium]